MAKTLKIPHPSIQFSTQTPNQTISYPPQQPSHQATTPNIPPIHQSPPLVSCVFCIDASTRSQLGWKSYGAAYLTSFLKALQLLYPNAVYRLTPIFFTSLPPAVPASQSLTQPYPFMALNQFSDLIPQLLPLKPPKDLISDPNHSFDYGGDHPAILDAIVRALELLDQNPTPTQIASHIKNQPQPTTTIYHKHILIISATDIGPPGMSFHPNKVFCFDPSIEELPRTTPTLNQSLEYDGITFQDLSGRFIQDQNGKWNLHDKHVGLLERKSIVLGLISTSRTPRLLSFIARHLGPLVFHNTRSQNLVRPLNKTHCIVISGFNELNSSHNTQAPGNLSSNAILTPSPNLEGTGMPNDIINKTIQERNLHPSNKRPRTESGDDQPLAATSSNPFTAPSLSAPPPSNGQTGLPHNGSSFPHPIPTHDLPFQVEKPHDILQSIPSSNGPPATSAQPNQSSDVADNSLAQGLSLLIGGNKTSPLPQTTVSSATNGYSNLPAGFPPNRSQLSSGVSSSTQTPPNDALSQALALLGGGSAMGGSTTLFPIQNTPSASTGNPQNLSFQTTPALLQKQSEPSPHEQQLQQAAPQAHHQIQSHLQVPQTMTQNPHQPFQPQQAVQPKQQQQLQQLQQLQESQKIQNQDYGSQRPQGSGGSVLPQAGGHGLLPAASIIPTHSRSHLQHQSQVQLTPQQTNMNNNINNSSSVPPSVRSHNPTNKALMEAAQHRAREQVRIVESKLQRGELAPKAAQSLKEKIKLVLMETWRDLIAPSGQIGNEPGRTQNLTSNLSPSLVSEDPLLWKGKLIWTINNSYHIGANHGNDELMGHHQQQKIIELSIPIGAQTAATQASNDWLRATAESWPKVWKVDGLRLTNIPELVQKSSMEKVGAITIHLMKNHDGNLNTNGGVSNEEIHSKLCETLGNTMSGIVRFDESGHGIVIVYHRGNRVLLGLLFLRSPIPFQLFQSPHSNNITRPNSTGSSRGIISPNHHPQQPHPSNSFNPINLSVNHPGLSHHPNNNFLKPNSNPNVNPNLQFNPQQQQLIQQILAQQQLQKNQGLSSSQQQHQPHQNTSINNNFNNQPNLNHANNSNLNSLNLPMQGLPPPSWQ